MVDDQELFRQLYPGLRRFAGAVAPLGVEPDDLVQEALTRTLRQRPLQELDEPGTYLRRAIVNLASNQRRDQARRTSILDRFRPGEQTTTDHYPSELLQLGRLSAKQRAVVHLKFVERATTGEIGALLAINDEAVRALLSRALRLLRMDLRDEEEERR
jgi:RNA polymerase sigma factor (sigma-70 family)